MVQMVITAAMVAAGMGIFEFRRFIVYNGWVVGLPCLVVLIVCQIAIYSCVSLRRKVPINYIILFVFTLCFAYFATQTAVYEGAGQPEVVYIAAILTVAITLAVTGYGFWEKDMYRVMTGMIFVFVMALCWFFILALIFGH